MKGKAGLRLAWPDSTTSACLPEQVQPGPQAAWSCGGGEELVGPAREESAPPLLRLILPVAVLRHWNLVSSAENNGRQL